jgi:hypothetical protein
LAFSKFVRTPIWTPRRRSDYETALALDIDSQTLIPQTAAPFTIRPVIEMGAPGWGVDQYWCPAKPIDNFVDNGRVINIDYGYSG